MAKQTKAEIALIQLFDDEKEARHKRRIEYFEVIVRSITTLLFSCFGIYMIYLVIRLMLYDFNSIGTNNPNLHLHSRPHHHVSPAPSLFNI